MGFAGFDKSDKLVATYELNEVDAYRVTGGNSNEVTDNLMSRRDRREDSKQDKNRLVYAVQVIRREDSSGQYGLMTTYWVDKDGKRVDRVTSGQTRVELSPQILEFLERKGNRV